MVRGFENLRGFTLIELAIVVSVIAVISASGMMMGSSMLESARRVNTNNKLDAIETALMAYRMTYNRIPCPTDATLTEASNNFGKEGATAGTCTGGTPAANASYTVPSGSGVMTRASNTTVVEGAVPVRTLNLPDEYQVDGWGRKFSYAVWAPLTAVGGFNTYGINPSCGGLQVRNAGGSSSYRTQSADYALISHGPDGHGAYLKGGTRYNAASTNADEQTNAHYSNLGADTGYAGAYVQHDWTQSPSDNLNVFQNIVRYKERWQMQNAADGFTPTGSYCLPGTRIDGQAANDNVYVAAIADVNCDGIPDLVIKAAAHGTHNGYVVFGTTAGFPDPLPLGSLHGSNGFAIDGISGWGTMGAGDITGDGCADIFLGDSINFYVLFGHANSGAPWSGGTVNIATEADGTHGFLLTSPTAGTTGWRFNSYSPIVANLEGATNTVNGVTYPLNALVADSYNSGSGAGRTFIVFGKTSGWTSTVNVDTYIDSTKGIYLTDRATCAGDNYYAAGNVTGHTDGKVDLVIGEHYDTGLVDVVYGGDAAHMAALNTGALGSLTTSQGTTFSCTGGGCGGIWSFALNMVVGDLNGDGSPEIVIDDYMANWGSQYGSGSVYIIPSSGLSWNVASYNVATLIGSGKAFHIDGDADNSHGWDFGYAMAIGNVNGTAYNALAVSGNGNKDNADGNIFVIYGKSTFANRDLAITPLTGAGDGFNIYGSYSPYDVGYTGGNENLMLSGDVTGDGYSELIINNSAGNGGGGSASGYAYVLYGNKKAPWTTPYPLSNIY